MCVFHILEYTFIKKLFSDVDELILHSLVVGEFWFDLDLVCFIQNSNKVVDVNWFEFSVVIFLNTSVK